MRRANRVTCDRCMKHKCECKRKTRLSATRRGYTYRWRVESQRYLDEHPICVICERDGKTTPASIVDHIIPHRGDVRLFWDVNNWQALCESCHNQKTAQELWGE